MRPQGLGLVVSFAAPLLNAWVVALLALNLGGKTITDAVMLGVLVWLGFFASQFAANTVFQRKSWSLFAMDAGHALIVQVAIAAIVTLWR